MGLRWSRAHTPRHSAAAVRELLARTTPSGAAAIVTSSVWQVAIAGKDAVYSSPAAGFDADVGTLVAQLKSRGADLGRVEVVPTKSQGEASALAPHVNLARGRNRQADVARNPLVYRDEKQPLTAQEYRGWLRRWAVRLVVASTSTPDSAGIQERRLVRDGLPFLREVWSDPTWTVYQVLGPTPLASAPADLGGADSAGVSVRMPVAGTSVLRIAWSPWLSLVDEQGDRVDVQALGGSGLAKMPEPRSARWHGSCSG